MLLASLIFACFLIVPGTQSRVRISPRFTTHLCTIHPWPELCDTEFERVVHPIHVALPARYENRIRALQPRTTNTNDARKLLRALRSVQLQDERTADKKSDKSANYDFIRFG